MSIMEKSAEIFGIPDEIQNLPRPQKVVVNSIIKSIYWQQSKWNEEVVHRQAIYLWIIVHTTLWNFWHSMLWYNWSQLLGMALAIDDFIKQPATRGTSLRKYETKNKFFVCNGWTIKCPLTMSLDISRLIPVQHSRSSNSLNLEVERSLKAYQEGM